MPNFLRESFGTCNMAFHASYNVLDILTIIYCSIVSGMYDISYARNVLGKSGNATKHISYRFPDTKGSWKFNFFCSEVKKSFGLPPTDQSGCGIQCSSVLI
jgi:hypothetical protein